MRSTFQSPHQVSSGNTWFLTDYDELSAITACTRNPNIANRIGWKSENYTSCIEATGDKFLQCIEQNSYSALNLITNSSPVVVNTFYWNRLSILCHNLEPETDVLKSIEMNSTLTVAIQLNNSLYNDIIIWDPKMQFMSFSTPDMIPRIHVKRKPMSDPEDYLSTWRYLKRCNNEMSIFCIVWSA